MLANGGFGTVQVVRVEIEGSIAAINAPATQFGGSGDELLTVSGKLGQLTALELADGDISVAKAGRIQAVRISDVTMSATGRIASLLANDIVLLDLSATSLGTLSVRRNVAAGLPGDVTASTLTLSGSFGKRKDGLSTAIVDGCTQDVSFHVLAGNVGSFTTGLFCNSQLYVGYTPPGSNDFGDLGVFAATNFIVRSFRTIAVPTAFASPAFVGSQVVAARLGTVRLSSVELDNFDILFGLRVKNGVSNNVGSVRIANTPPFDPLVDYDPSASGEVVPAAGSQDDFCFFD